jgi:hypothetical protein
MRGERRAPSSADRAVHQEAGLGTVHENGREVDTPRFHGLDPHEATLGQVLAVPCTTRSGQGGQEQAQVLRVHLVLLRFARRIPA